jgi:integrase
MAKLRADTSPAARALEFIALTAARRSEVLGIPGDFRNRGVSWGDINLDTALWTIAAWRMKAGNEHVVPLSEPALAILRGAPDDRIFATTPEAVWQLMRKLRPGMTVHGLRSTFRDFSGNMTDHSRQAIEESLAHTLGAVEGAHRLSTPRHAAQAPSADGRLGAIPRSPICRRQPRVGTDAGRSRAPTESHHQAP